MFLFNRQRHLPILRGVVDPESGDFRRVVEEIGRGDLCRRL